MGDVVLFICSKKENPALRQRRHPHIRLARSSTVFPREAKRDLSPLLEKGCWLVEAVFPDEELAKANSEWLAEKKLRLSLSGECFTASFLKELETLEAWKKHGVCEEEEKEFLARKNALASEWSSLSRHLFQASAVHETGLKIKSLDSFPRSQAPFASRNECLKKEPSARFDFFKRDALELLHSPRELSEIAKLSNMSKGNARRWLRRMERGGLVAKTRKKHGVGRPRDVYYRSLHI